MEMWWSIAQKVVLFWPPRPCPWICPWQLSDVSIWPCLQTSNCLMPGALTCCSRRKFPFPWEGGIHLPIPTRPPAETSPLMTTTPLCCLSAPCWLCKRTGPGGAQRNFIKCQSSIHWWATCHRQSRSQEKVLQDQGLEKVTDAWLWCLKQVSALLWHVTWGGSIWTFFIGPLFDVFSIRRTFIECLLNAHDRRKEWRPWCCCRRSRQLLILKYLSSEQMPKGATHFPNLLSPRNIQGSIWPCWWICIA